MKIEITAILGMLATVLSMIGVLWKIGHDLKDDWKKEMDERLKEREERAKERLDRSEFERQQKLRNDEDRNTLNEILTTLTDLQQSIGGISAKVEANQAEIKKVNDTTLKAHDRLDIHEKALNFIMRTMVRLKIPGAHKYTSKEKIGLTDIEEEEDDDAAIFALLERVRSE